MNGVLFYLGFSIFLSVIIFFLSFLAVPKEASFEKLTAYECGFEPFSNARGQFDVRFYLVAILFIIFDLEIIYLFPWLLVLNKIGIFGFFTMLIFLFILAVGFLYEWNRGALDWL